MDRREFSVRLAGVFALAGLPAGCSTVSDARTVSATSCANFEEILKEFERIVWDTVKYAALIAEPRVTFQSSAECIQRYKVGHSDWYEKMKTNLKKDCSCIGNPIDSDDSDFVHYYESYYSCCTFVGRKAARLAATDGMVIKADKHFEDAMLAAQEFYLRRKAKLENTKDGCVTILAGMCS